MSGRKPKHVRDRDKRLAQQSLGNAARVHRAGSQKGHMRSAWDNSNVRGSIRVQWGNPDHRRNSAVTVFAPPNR